MTQIQILVKYFFLALVQQVMGLLAFPLNTPVQPYRDLLDQARWQTIVQQFRLAG